MEITFTESELAKLVSDIADWYNKQAVFIITNGFKQFNPMTGTINNPSELFHKLAKQFQEENPKPDWRDFLE